ncbi:hypothetical protein [Sphingobium yanoikuyae]|uniref:hypothetical protein n=1 Tax=Sphingobium yanoikuyae TaxID=13690 RepID=UPI003F06A1C1
MSDADARGILNIQAEMIFVACPEVCDDAGLAKVDRAFLWRQQLLNDYAFEGYVDRSPAGL